MIFSQRWEPMKPPAPIMHIVNGFIGFPSRSTLADDAIVSLSKSLSLSLDVANPFLSGFLVRKELWSVENANVPLGVVRVRKVKKERESEREIWEAMERGK